MFNFSLLFTFPCWLLGLTKTCHVVSCRMLLSENKSINKWQRKTEVTTGAAAIKSNMLLIRSGSIIELVTMPFPMKDLCHALPDIHQEYIYSRQGNI